MSVGGFTPVMPSAAHDARVQERITESNQRATQPSADKESEATSDRDADGRQAWQWNQQQRKQQSAQEQRVQDISGKTGTTLDLDG
jgi:hypothetical protein